MNIRIFLFFFLICQTFSKAQQKEITIDEANSVNRFLIYSNSLVRWISEIDEDLSLLNADFINFVEKKIPFKYKPDNNIGFLNLDSLYNTVLSSIKEIPKSEAKLKAIELLSKTKSIQIKIESSIKSLDRFVNSSEYKNDSLLKKGFEILQKIEVAYFDIYALQEKLYWSTQTIFNSYQNQSENYLLLLDKSLQSAKRVMKALRAADKGPIIKEDLIQLNSSIIELKKYRSELLKDKDEFTLQCYNQILVKTQSIYKSASDFVANNNRHSRKKHGESYYFYNEELLPFYNLEQEGAVYYYNRILEKNRIRGLICDEMPPIFEVLLPKHPYYDSLKSDFIPDVEAFMAQLEQKKDSLENIEQQKKEQPKGFDKNMNVSDIKTGESFRIENLYFMADSTSFTSNSIAVLNDLVEFLIKNPSIKVEIGGHTNGLPAHSYCDRLSSERADYVRKYLLSKGVSSKKIISKGYGKRQPLANNSTDEGRKLNQRVEVKILEK